MNKKELLEAIKLEIETIGFEKELKDKEVNFDYTNPTLLRGFLKEDEAYASLSDLVQEYNSLPILVSKEDMKKVYVMLKERMLHPKGEFDKMGRFYLNDSELVNVRRPSVKYPYSQMNAGRTSKFIKAIAEKYKCTDFDDLKSCFHQP